VSPPVTPNSHKDHERQPAAKPSAAAVSVADAPMAAAAAAA
jgi:hypothetical protein